MRIGVFGGTFDPPHVGHLILAAEAVEQLHLDQLLWVLTPDPPHKQDQAISRVDLRLEMVRIAIGDNPVFQISRIELDRPGPHFAVDTVRLLKENFPGDQLIYLIGGDSLRDLPLWHTPVEFVRLVDGLGVMPRPGDLFDLFILEQALPGISKKVSIIQTPQIDISSHEIRMRAKAGREFRYFLPPVVFQFIADRGLYAEKQSNRVAEDDELE